MTMQHSVCSGLGVCPFQSKRAAHIYTCKHRHAQMHTQIHTHAHTHTNTHAHTRTHTYTHAPIHYAHHSKNILRVHANLYVHVCTECECDHTPSSGLFTGIRMIHASSDDCSYTRISHSSPLSTSYAASPYSSLSSVHSSMQPMHAVQ